MPNKTLLAVSLTLCSSLVFAEMTTTTTTSTPSATTPPPAVVKQPTTTPADSGTDMPKSTWFDTIVPMLPSLICKGFMGDPELKQRLDSIKMNYDQCVSAIPESVNKCKDQLYASVPDKINNTDAATWGKTLGECIGKDFAMKYLLPKQ